MGERLAWSATHTVCTHGSCWFEQHSASRMGVVDPPVGLFVGGGDCPGLNFWLGSLSLSCGCLTGHQPWGSGSRCMAHGREMIVWWFHLMHACSPLVLMICLATLSLVCGKCSSPLFFPCLHSLFVSLQFEMDKAKARVSPPPVPSTPTNPCSTQ